MNKFKKFISNEVEDYRMLLKNVPTLTMVFFVLSVIYMNIFAGKELFMHGHAYKKIWSKSCN